MENMKAKDLSQSENDTAVQEESDKAAKVKYAVKMKHEKPLWVFLFKAFVAVCVFCVMGLGVYAGWTNYQLNKFQKNVQGILDSGKGMETLRLVDDWRVDDLTETTKRVSRADGHYVLFVWCLPDGKYLVETVEK